MQASRMREPGRPAPCRLTTPREGVPLFIPAICGRSMSNLRSRVALPVDGCLTDYWAGCGGRFCRAIGSLPLAGILLSSPSPSSPWLP